MPITLASSVDDALNTASFGFIVLTNPCTVILQPNLPSRLSEFFTQQKNTSGKNP